MIYFTSDLHLGHSGIIHMRNRPFKDVDEMNRMLLANYNSIVRKDDTVYILGDIAHHLKVDEVNQWISKLNGKKILLIGNHDKKYDSSLFDEMRDFMTLSLNGTYFALMHYPLLSCPKMKRGSIQVHGHIHSDGTYNRENLEKGIRRYDAGVDANQFLPVSVNQVIRFFEEGKCL